MTRLAFLLVACIVLAGCIPPAPVRSGLNPDAPYSELHTHPYLVCTRLHESGGNRVWPYEDGYSYNTGNGYFGAFQFSLGTWQWAVVNMRGGVYAPWANVLPSDAPWDVQDFAAAYTVVVGGPGHFGNRCREHL